MIMKKYLQKMLLVFLALVLTFYSVATPVAYAQSVGAGSNSTTWYNTAWPGWYLKVFDQTNPSEIFGERYTAAQVQWIIWSLGAFLLNSIFGGHTEVVSCLFMGDVPACAPTILTAFKEIIDIISPLTYNNNGSPNMLAMVGTNHISGISYTKNLIAKFNPVSDVQAQREGFGFSVGARSVIQLWQVSRNIAFAFLIVVIIIMAFMIMFRVKISPQVVISVQSALPRIIGALILITFSYAIAGFMIDLMYVVVGLLAASITGAGLTNHTTMQLFDSFTTGENAIGLLFEFWFAFMVVAFMSIFSSINPLTWFGGLLLLLFSVLFVLVAIVFTFRILIVIFRNFALVILTIVTGPFEILFGTIAAGSGFGPWLRRLLSYLAVYPVMGLLFFLAFFFLAQSLNMGLAGLLPADWITGFVGIFPFNPKFNVITGNTWDPPLSTFLVMGDALLWAILAYIIITLIPRTTDIIQGLISGRPFAFGTAIGEAMGPINWGRAQAWNFMGGDIIRKRAEVEGLSRTAQGISYLSTRQWVPRRARGVLGGWGEGLSQASESAKNRYFPD